MQVDINNQITLERIKKDLKENEYTTTNIKYMLPDMK